MEIRLLIPVFLGFLVTLFSLPVWIKKAKEIGLIWEDMNKPEHPKNVAGSGGVSVFLGFMLGVLIYAALITFYFKSTDFLIKIFSIIICLLIAGSIGFMDDLFGWRKGGLSIRSRLILLVFASIPLIVINAGESSMIGIELGIIYPLVIIPIGIMGASVTFNFLAGYNGLEASQGILILSALSFIAFRTGQGWLAIVALCMIAPLIAFYFFNRVPARVFPGDIMTYSVGALIAIIAVLANREKIAVFFFIPYMMETVLKSRGKLKKESFGKVNPDGSLEVPYDKIYGLEHLAIYALKKIKPSKKVYEADVVYLINAFQIVIIILGFILFRSEIFI
jgi:UDP-N-acetylglucosamine--dolichyl-phosphate N-acetylglucosaminephosphotransferase